MCLDIQLIHKDVRMPDYVLPLASISTSHSVRKAVGLHVDGNWPGILSTKTVRYLPDTVVLQDTFSGDTAQLLGTVLT